MAAPTTTRARATGLRPEIPVGTRLHLVTGKGGTGKTTVAAALALALATTGKKVLLAEVEGRQAIAQLFDVQALPYEERRLAPGAGNGSLWGLAVDPEQAMIEYLEMFYGLKRSGRGLKRMGAVDFVTTVAPGLRDVLITGKIKEAVTRTNPDGHLTYDAVVVDAPPTGRITRFLNATREVSKVAKVGPISRQSDGVVTLLRGKQSAVHIVTVLEEMPVQETLDGVGELRALDLPVGGVVVNMTREPFLAPAELVAAREKRLDRQELASGLKLAGVDPEDTLVDALLAEAAAHATRVQLEEAERTRLTGLGRPIYELPLLPDALDLGGLYRLADLLCEQGMA
jgi:anion-transporting  ArsA/GET3 family ATPase